jgi:hypothetical protein
MALIQAPRPNGHRWDSSTGRSKRRKRRLLEWRPPGELAFSSIVAINVMVVYVTNCRALFQNKATRGQETKAEGDTLWTKHESLITNVVKLSGSKISTSALDGRVVVWNLAQADLGVSMASLGIR